MPTAFPEAAPPISAWLALFELADLQAGRRILINGAGGGVGVFAVHLAKRAAPTASQPPLRAAPTPSASLERRNHRLEIHVIATAACPPADLATVHQLGQAGKLTGKVILTPDN